MPLRRANFSASGRLLSIPYWRTPPTDELSPKLHALLGIAGQVQESGRAVTHEAVALARMHGANDREIHDTVLIAATFCMFNRYVDGLDTLTPSDPQEYAAMGKRLSSFGYAPPKTA